MTDKPQTCQHCGSTETLWETREPMWWKCSHCDGVGHYPTEETGEMPNALEQNRKHQERR